MDFVNPDHEQLVVALNTAVIASGEEIEGNLYYWNGQVLTPAEPPTPNFADKRRQISEIAKRKTHVLEIGVNAGHSAALMLTANADLRYTGIDLCWHRYTTVCADILQDRFQNRFGFIAGNSVHAYPLSFKALTECDLVHIDGGHTIDVFAIDLCHALTLPYSPDITRHILIDDTDNPMFKAGFLAEIDYWVNEGWIEIDTMGGLVTDGSDHLLVRVLRRP